MINPRILILVSTPFFILLFFLGMIRGNTIITILSRSLTGTFIFSALTAAAMVIFKKMLSGIDESGSVSEVSPGLNEGEGGSLNVLLDDENPYSGKNEKRPEPAYSDDMPDMDDEESLSADEAGFIEEVEEESLGDIGFIDNSEELDEIVEVMNDSPDINEGFRNGNLPEIDRNSLVFDSPSEGKAAGKGNDALGMLGDNVDAGTMAKAIKTILNRDQKG